jgi:kumamolisin
LRGKIGAGRAQRELQGEDLEKPRAFYRETSHLEITGDVAAHPIEFDGAGGFLCLERKGGGFYPSQGRAVLFFEVEKSSATLGSIGRENVVEAEPGGAVADDRGAQLFSLAKNRARESLKTREGVRMDLCPQLIFRALQEVLAAEVCLTAQARASNGQRGVPMAFDRYVAIPGSERRPMPGAIVTGPCDPNEPIRVTVVLRSRGVGKSSESLERVIARGERLTREELAARYGADAQDVERVEEFARAFGLTAADVNLGARTLVLSGTAQAFHRAFRIGLVNYRYPGGTHRGYTGPVHVPLEMKDVIRDVLGLDDRPHARPHYRIRPKLKPRAASPVSYSPIEVAELYDFPTLVSGQGETIGMIELGGGYNPSDLSTYFRTLGISPAPSVVSVSVDGQTNSPTGDPSGPDAEVMLDIEVAGAVAPGAKIVVYFAPNTDAGFLDAIHQAVMDKTNNPSVISISWGGPESSWSAQSMQSFNSAFQSAAGLGITVCVAGGDQGSTDGVNDGQAHVDFPASSPYALACGGTHLIGSGTTISDEEVWNDLPNDGATGGGVSANFPLPSWQANAGVPASVNPGNAKGRGVPDVAGDADPLTGYQVDVDGSNTVVGGTSAVAPLWAGLIALINQSLGKSVGYLNPTLYTIIAASAGAFHDITVGNNGSYAAGPGWDACTGWGTPNGQVILQRLSTSLPS